MTDERLTLRQAAARLGVSESAIRKRVERGTLDSDKGADGRRYVYLDTGADNVAEIGAEISATGERDTLMSEMVEELRDEVHYLRGQLQQELERRSAEADRYQQIVAALTTANASLSERLRSLEPPQEPPSEQRESPQTVEDEPERAEPRAATGEAEEATERRAAQPVRRLPLWQWVLGGALSLLAFPVSELLGVLIGTRVINLPDWLALPVVFVPVLLPGVFGYWVGLRLRNLSFWRHLAPMGGLLLAGVFIGSWLLWRYIAWITVWLFGFGTTGPSIGPSLARHPSLVGLFLVISPAALYSFATLLGNARQRRKREKLSEAGPSESRWSPRQQALVGLAGTIISALIGLIGTILQM